MVFSRPKTELVSADRALRGREHYEFAIPATHFVNGRPIAPPFPDGLQTVVFGSGCFWGTEELFWQAEGVWTTAVGYAGGSTRHPTYEEVCSGRTGHTEAVLVVYDPALTSFAQLLRLFFETHDPTQGMRQGNDVGTQYRSAIYYTDESQGEVGGEEATRGRGLRFGHDRDRASRAVLLRRGVPPAIPGEEPERLSLPQH